MARYKERIMARKMRKNGISIDIIARKLDVSKSSVSLWCRDIILTLEQSEILAKNKGISHMNGRRIGSETNRRKKLESIIEADEWGQKIISRVSKRDLLLVAMSLYWCEGSKTDSTSSFMLVNSDPKMVLVMKKFLVKVMNVQVDDIVCGIQINIVHKRRIKKVLIFWKKLLELRDSQMRKPYFVNTKLKKVYENHDQYFGVCRLFVRKSKKLKYKMLGMIKAFKNEILSA